MVKNNTLYIGLDTHKSFTQVAYCLDGREDKPMHLGKIDSTKTGITKMVRHFQSRYPELDLCFVYEAGPCGYWIYRLISKLGFSCFIVAPSLIPKKPGQRIKTDKRDAELLARLLKQGDIDPIYVPEPEDESVRDLARLREAAMKDLNDAKYQLKAFLLRNHINYAGTANWGPKHLRWLTEMVLPHPAQQIVIQEMIQTVNERLNRLKRLENELTHQIYSWRYYPVVKAIQAMRGVRLIVAAGVISELGDLTRFDHPKKLMAYLGLVPSEHSSGGKRNLGSITKCGNQRARRLLVEGAHSYRHSARVSKDIQKRLEGLPQTITDIAWKAQLRLCKRYQRMMNCRKNYNVVITAIAREMIAYIWAIAKEVILTPVNPKERIVRIPA